MLKSTARPLHRSEDDGNLLRPARPLLVQRGLLHPGEAAPGLLAAEDRHHLGSSAGAQPGTWSPEAATFLAVSPLLPSILLAKQVGHLIRQDRLRAFEFRDPRYSSLPWSCPRPPGPEPLPLLQASPLVYQVLTLFVRILVPLKTCVSSHDQHHSNNGAVFLTSSFPWQDLMLLITISY